MARKTSLREFQMNFAQRLRDLSTKKTSSSKLGFQVGSENWFVDLADVSEVIPVPNLVTVPLTQDWFKGISNIRGKLYSIADFSQFQGSSATPINVERRVVLIHEKLIEGSGLMVSRMMGLRNPELFSLESNGVEGKSWVRATFLDAAGARWHELDVVALTKNAKFLEVSL
jgi:twitching motility protein PilI